MFELNRPLMVFESKKALLEEKYLLDFPSTISTTSKNLASVQGKRSEVSIYCTLYVKKARLNLYLDQIMFIR